MPLKHPKILRSVSTIHVCNDQSIVSAECVHLSDGIPFVPYSITNLNKQ